MFRVRTQFQGSQGGILLSTQYFNIIGGLTAANAVADLHAFWNTIKSNICNDLTIQIEPEVAEINVATGDLEGLVPVSSTQLTGGEPSDPEPWMTQGLLQLRTGTFIGGREIRGRIFIPGATFQQSSGGVPTSTYKTLVEGAAATLLSSADSELMVWSKKNGDSAPVISATMWSQWAVLRSRRL